MTTLNEVLMDESKLTAIIEDCARLIDDEVAAKRGIGGMAVKAGYKVVQGVKPGFVRNVIRALLPEFAEAMEPIRQEATANGESVGAYFAAHSSRVADALLAVTDSKAADSKHGAVKAAYGRLRGSAKNNVESAVPGLGRIVEKYV